MDNTIQSSKLVVVWAPAKKPSERMFNQVFHKTPANKRSPGRSRARWIDSIQQNLKCLRINGHKTSHKTKTKGIE